MGIIDEAQTIFDRGCAAAKGAVCGIAVEQQAFAKAFARLCTDGWQQGWHEANGGNLSYRLKPQEVASCRPFFSDDSPWVPLDVRAPHLCGDFIAISASGCFLQNIARDFESNAGIIEIAQTGGAWRAVWGFKGGNRPTSELDSHILVHSARKELFGDASRVLYHAHPPYIVSLTKVLPLDARTFTRTLWKAMLESMVVLPAGVGVVSWMVPGDAAIATETADAMRIYDVCVWAHHGLFCPGADFDSAFGRAQTVEKASRIYALARMMNKGCDEGLASIPDEGLRDIAKAYNLSANEAFL